MCVVSMIGDHYKEKWDRKWPEMWPPELPAPMPTWPPLPHPGETPFVIPHPEITKEEFDALRREVMEMKELLKRAIKYDQDNGEPECQIEEKMELLRKMAEMVGISLDDVIGPKKKKVLLSE